MQRHQTTYVVYDPPQAGLPYLGVLLSPDRPMSVFTFKTFEEAREFLTSNAIRVGAPAAIDKGKCSPEMSDNLTASQTEEQARNRLIALLGPIAVGLTTEELAAVVAARLKGAMRRLHGTRNPHS